jgi:hypothetical protein
MDLKAYYRRIREMQQQLPEDSIVLVSQETPDGGKSGVRVEVTREIAAKMLVEGAAKLATADDALEFRQQNADAHQRAEQLAAASRMQVTVVAAPELRNPKGPARPSRDQG